MKRAASLLLAVLCSNAVACAGNAHRRVTTRPASLGDHLWTPVAVTDIRDQDLRRTTTDLLMLVDTDVLWPGFKLGDDPAIVVDSRDESRPVAYCIGHCVPRIQNGSGTSRLWRRVSADAIAPGKARFTPLDTWGLKGEGEVVAVGYQRREDTVSIVMHEHFHLHYQTEYVLGFGDEIRGDGGGASRLTRADLEGSYSGTEPVMTELREECIALVDALRAGTADRPGAMAALRRFMAVRDARRARPGSPTFEEDFWERQEGVPVNLERRVAARMNFTDASVIGTALSNDGCDAIPRVSYFLLTGGLESAVLDALDDPSIWPAEVYPRGGAPASSLYVLVRTLLDELQER